MRRFRTLTIMVVLLAAAAAVAGPADNEAPKRPRGTADVVAVKARPASVEVAAGGTATFEVEMSIAKTWHLYAHKYSQDPESFYIGIQLLPVEGSPFPAVKVVYPEAEEGTFMGDKVAMHEGTDVLKVSVAVPADAKKGEHELTLNLTAQACDDKICLAPTDLPVTVKLKVL